MDLVCNNKKLCIIVCLPKQMLLKLSFLYPWRLHNIPSQINIVRWIAMHTLFVLLHSQSYIFLNHILRCWLICIDTSKSGCNVSVISKILLFVLLIARFICFRCCRQYGCCSLYLQSILPICQTTNEPRSMNAQKRTIEQ